MTQEDLYPYIDQVAETSVTSFFMSPNFGMNVIYPGKVSDMIGTNLTPSLQKKFDELEETDPKSSERGMLNLLGLVEQGHDPLELILDRAKEKGMETFISFRLNEVHAVDEEENWILSRFWLDHPEWWIGKPKQPLGELYMGIMGPNTHPIVAGWLPGGLNFAVPKVRERRLAQLRECCESYAIDGLDLDFQRFPMYFPEGTEKDNTPVMTDWMREVRKMTNEVGEKRGRPILLSVRTMTKPEQNLGIGLDLETWAKEGLVDFVVQSHYLRNDFPLPVKEYRNQLPPEMPLYASIEVEREPDRYREIARHLWQEGADGILVFNFFTTRENDREPPFYVLNEIGEIASE